MASTTKASTTTSLQTSRHAAKTPSNIELNMDFQYHTVNLVDHLGQGAYGVVYRGQNKDTKETIAAKRVNVGNEDKSDSYGQGVMREIKALRAIKRHPHIIHLVDFHYAKQCFWLIMEFCEMGDLQVYSRKNRPSIDFTIDIVQQTTSGLKYLHENEVVHRDMKPGNILLREEDGKIMAKVTDFGFARIGDKSKSSDEWLLSSDVGTFAYKAPEFYNEELLYTKTVDTFSLGLILLAMILYGEEKTKELFPKTAKNLKKRNTQTVGQEMFQIHDLGAPIPDIVEIENSDEYKLKRCKELVKRMCMFDGSDRIPLGEAEDILAELSGNAAGKSTEPEKPEQKENDIESGEDLAIKFAHEAIIEKWKNQYKELKDKNSKEKANEIFSKLGLDEKMQFVNGFEINPNEVKAGDMVRVNPDRTTFEKLQQGYGGYKPEMANILNKVGKVARKILHVFSVKFESGKDAPRFLFNEENLTKIKEEDEFVNHVSPEGKTQAEGPLQEGDLVRIRREEEAIRKSHKNMDRVGWNDRMKDCLGFTGIVLGVRSNGSVTVRCINGDIWIFNPDVLRKLDLRGQELEVADLVMVIRDKDALETLQKQIGAWQRDMDKKSGKFCILREILEQENCLLVEIGGKKLKFNKEAISLVAKGVEYMHAMTKKSDL